MAKEAGFDITPDPIPSEIFYNERWLKLPAGAGDWSPRPTMDGQYRITYSCGGVWNESHWCDKTFDSMMNEARSISDEAERKELERQLQEYFAANSNSMIPYHYPGISMHGPNVQNYLEHPMVYWTDFRRVGVSA
jgi:peptide/nickel transport system substrate-binding protein